ncbi:high frequency lysogenization protein HflD [uncultured Porticoccus sp.]|uniref:high frequency lysogenization protein HflD n=1 Tax=uncultured Porticoccus sp. TaxID=1256050 RepID=UPI0030D997CE
MEFSRVVMLLKKPTKDQIIALSGVFQACQLVETLAKTGSIPTDRFQVCIESLFQQNPDSTEQVFGSVENLQLGMETLQELLTLQTTAKQSDTLRYAVGVIHLSRKLLNNKTMISMIGERLEQADRQATHFSSVSHTNVIANLAQIYQDSISTFRYRIQVNGYAGYLQQDSIAQRIRCLLFAGIRAAILWHQLGGKRYHLIFSRKQLLAQLHTLRT